MLFTSHHLKILKSIVTMMSVDVVNNFFVGETPTQVLLHDGAMFVSSPNFSIGLASAPVTLLVARIHPPAPRLLFF